MIIEQLMDMKQLNSLIEKELVPYVKRVDQEAFYAKHFIEKLGQKGYFQDDGPENKVVLKRLTLVEEVAKVCMTTAFCIWGHLAATAYVTHTENVHLRKRVLPKLLSGTLLAGTGLSNPLKSFAKLETIRLKAEKVSGGYIICGNLPAVSNIGYKQAFAFIAETKAKEQVMGFLSCGAEGLTLKPRTGYVGLNGSATYSCIFDNVLLPEEQIISKRASEFVQQIRARFVSYQIPLALGVTASCIDVMEEMKKEYFAINQYLRVQPEQLKERYETLKSELYMLIETNNFSWEELTTIRLESVYLTLDAVQASMIYHGGRGYVQDSDAARKLREAYFLVNLTPTVKHLETLKHR